MMSTRPARLRSAARDVRASAFVHRRMWAKPHRHGAAALAPARRDRDTPAASDPSASGRLCSASNRSRRAKLISGNAPSSPCMSSMMRDTQRRLDLRADFRSAGRLIAFTEVVWAPSRPRAGTRARLSISRNAGKPAQLTQVGRNDSTIIMRLFSGWAAPVKRSMKVAAQPGLFVWVKISSNWSTSSRQRWRGSSVRYISIAVASRWIVPARQSGANRLPAPVARCSASARLRSGSPCGLIVASNQVSLLSSLPGARRAAARHAPPTIAAAGWAGQDDKTLLPRRRRRD